MKPTAFLRSFLFLAFSSLLCTIYVHAFSTSWNVNADGGRATGTNRLSASAPGATVGTSNTGTASFDIALSVARTVTVDANRNLQGINFTNTSGVEAVQIPARPAPGASSVCHEPNNPTILDSILYSLANRSTTPTRL